MPNWCSNELTIRHTDEHTITELVRHVTELIQRLTDPPRDDEQLAHLFQYLRPMPHDIGDDWYNWRLEHWDCKWDASDLHLIWHDNHSLCMTFNTPWAPPIALYRYLEREGWTIEEASTRTSSSTSSDATPQQAETPSMRR